MEIHLGWGSQSKRLVVRDGRAHIEWLWRERGGFDASPTGIAIIGGLNRNPFRSSSPNCRNFTLSMNSGSPRSWPAIKPMARQCLMSRSLASRKPEAMA